MGFSRVRIKRGHVPATCLALLALGCGGGAACAKSAPEGVPQVGPAPDWARFRSLAEDAVKDKLIDPESAQFVWKYGYYPSGFKPLFQPRVFGYLACGTVNAKNRMGGYHGAETFLIVIDNDQVLFAQIGAFDGSVEVTCDNDIKTGLLPPVSKMPTASVAALGGNSGLSLRPMPEGAYVLTVASGSPAALAGIKPGMVISAVNGITLAGMGDIMLRVIDGASGEANLAIIGGAPIHLPLPPAPLAGGQS